LTLLIRTGFSPYVSSGKGAAAIVSLGQRPRIQRFPQIRALKAGFILALLKRAFSAFYVMI